MVEFVKLEVDEFGKPVPIHQPIDLDVKVNHRYGPDGRLIFEPVVRDRQEVTEEEEMATTPWSKTTTTTLPPSTTTPRRIRIKKRRKKRKHLPISDH